LKHKHHFWREPKPNKQRVNLIKVEPVKLRLFLQSFLKLNLDNYKFWPFDFHLSVLHGNTERKDLNCFGLVARFSLALLLELQAILLVE